MTLDLPRVWQGISQNCLSPLATCPYTIAEWVGHQLNRCVRLKRGHGWTVQTNVPEQMNKFPNMSGHLPALWSICPVIGLTSHSWSSVRPLPSRQFMWCPTHSADLMVGMWATHQYYHHCPWLLSWGLWYEGEIVWKGKKQYQFSLCTTTGHLQSQDICWDSNWPIRESTCVKGKQIMRGQLVFLEGCLTHWFSPPTVKLASGGAS